PPRQRIPVLLDEVKPVVLHGDDQRRGRLVDHPEDPGRPVGMTDVVLTYRHPTILIDHTAGYPDHVQTLALVDGASLAAVPGAGAESAAGQAVPAVAAADQVAVAGPEEVDAGEVVAHVPRRVGDLVAVAAEVEVVRVVRRAAGGDRRPGVLGRGV